MLISVNINQTEVKQFHIDNTMLDKEIRSATIVLNDDEEQKIEISPEGVKKSEKVDGKVLLKQ